VLAVLQELSGGRMDLGIGRGDSARRVLGKPPTSLALLEEATNVIRDLCEGREVTYEDTKLRFDWAPKTRLPVWIAGYGPKALELTGRVADGAIIQLADYVRNRPGYDYKHPAESGSTNAAFVDDESVDRFCVIGEVDEHIAKLRELAAIGVRHFNIYLMSGEEERILEVYGDRIIPALTRVEAASA